MRFTRITLLVSLLALVVVPAAFALRFTDDSYFMPTGVVGQAYSKQFNGAGGCGPALPYQYTLIGGKLPPGLGLSFAGAITGVPTQAGTFSFWVNLSDQNPPTADWCRPSEAQREFTIEVTGGAPVTPLSIVQSSLAPKATVIGQPYRFQFTAQGGGTQTWTVQSGALPAGVALSSSGLLSGTPATAGDFTFTVRVTDGSRSATQTFTLSVVTALKISAADVPAGEVALPFKLALAAAGGKAPYAWTVASGNALPSGLTLDGGTGVVSGVPTVAGTFPVKLTVTDSLGFTDTLDVQLDLAAKLVLVKKALPSAKAGHAFRARLVAHGGVASQTWKLLHGSLPAGIHLSKRTGELSGTPRHAGTSTIDVQVTDALGGVSHATFVLKVRA
jgi:large repetitive protein